MSHYLKTSLPLIEASANVKDVLHRDWLRMQGGVIEEDDFLLLHVTYAVFNLSDTW